MKKALRLVRNTLALLGLFFLYLIVHGMVDCAASAASGDVPCAYARCM